MEYPLCRIPESTPRQRTGACSMASDAPTPHSPPMPMPKSMRRMKKTVKLGAKPHSSSMAGEEKHIHHQRTAAAVAVGHHAEEQRADRPHRQRRGDAEDDVALGNVEVLGQRVEQEDDDEEIEGVERPAEKAGAHRVPAIGSGIRRLGPQFRHVRVKVSDAAGNCQRYAAIRIAEQPWDQRAKLCAREGSWQAALFLRA